MTDALAAGLAEIVFKKGDRAAIYMKNSIALVVAFYALQKLGGIVAWVNPNYRKNEAEYILGNSEAKGVFIFDKWNGYDYLDNVLKIKKSCPGLKTVIHTGTEKRKGAYSFSGLIEDGYRKKYSPAHIDTDEDLAMLLYTSGTTGSPKGAMITHFAAVRAGSEYSKGVNATSDDIFIGFLPMSHSYGCGSILIQPILLHATVILMDKFDTKNAFEIIEKEKVTLQLAAPAHYILELNHKSRKNYDTGSLRAGLNAGQIATEGLISRVEKEVGI